MTAAARIAAFVGLLVVVFAAASLAGAEVDPSVDSSAHDDAEMADSRSHQTDTNDAADAETHQSVSAVASSETLPGLAVAQSGYRLVPAQTEMQAERERFSFRIVDADGAVVEDFDVEHERRMHLIVVRRDFVNFQHVHPRQLVDGTWQVEVDFAPAGVYRVFADFSAEGTSLTLATDVFASGEFRSTPLPLARATADAGNGYEVSIESHGTKAGASTPVQFTVSRAGRELDSVEPYLGADGHLVALREHDQAYLHTHPQGEAGGTGPISFEVEYPTPGRYRLFLQFRHGGAVRTAAFTEAIATDADQTAPAGAAPASGGEHGHE